MKNSVTFLKRGDLPNQDGFEFIAILSDGTMTRDKVVKNMITGLHSCDSFNTMIGWRTEAYLISKGLMN